MDQELPDAANPRDPMKPLAPLVTDQMWDYPPWHRWTFQHMREMTATAQVWRGSGPVSPLPEALADVAALTFSANGKKQSIAQFLDGSFTDGFLILSRGRVIFERYMNGLTAHGQHLAMSVSKSITATAAGVLIHRGILDPHAPVTHYLPELSATAYKGALVQQVLDMTTGVLFDESYTTEGSHMQKLDLATGWRPHTRPDWPQTIWRLILELKEQARPHGEAFEYRSIETDVLGFMMERATGKRLADILSEELWQKIGAEQDGYITVDRGGYAMANGGFNATLRDYGRFALLHVNSGKADGKQVVPEAWLNETRRGDHDIFRGVYRGALPRGAYHNQFWIEDPDRRAYMCRGIHGQYIYIDPEAEFAAVKLSTWPEFVSDERSIETLAAIKAIRDAIV